MSAKIRGHAASGGGRPVMLTDGGQAPRAYISSVPDFCPSRPLRRLITFEWI